MKDFTIQKVCWITILPVMPEREVDPEELDSLHFLLKCSNVPWVHLGTELLNLFECQFSVVQQVRVRVAELLNGSGGDGGSVLGHTRNELLLWKISDIGHKWSETILYVS